MTTETNHRVIRIVRVFVIGGAGVLGSQLVDHLIEDRNCNVLVLDNLLSGRREFVHPKAEFQHFDITSSEQALRSVLSAHETAFLFNYAAEPYIPVSYERPLRVFEINAYGALKVVMAAEALAIPMLQVSSAEIYGNSSGGKIDEDFPVHPHSSYGAAKAAIDSMISVRYAENKCPVVSLRQFNCVGPRETHPYVVPEIIQQVHHRGGNLSLGNNSVRDFQYSGDAVEMAVCLLEKGEYGQVYNMGSTTPIRIYDLARLIGDLMGHPQVTITPDDSRRRPWEIWSLCSDNTKLYKTIGATREDGSDWHTPLQKALETTIKYYESEGGTWVWQ